MSQALTRVAPRRPAPVEGPFDFWLIVAVAMLVSLGLVMVASASISIGRAPLPPAGAANTSAPCETVTFGWA